MNITWTPERISRLTELWADGVSASLIAKEMELGKNAVIGKAHRLELPRRPSPILRNGPAPKTDVIAEATGAEARKLADDRKPQWLLSHRMAPSAHSRTCQFIAGEPSSDDTCKCGEPVRRGSSYCPAHHRRCWMRPKPRRAA